MTTFTGELLATLAPFHEPGGDVLAELLPSSALLPGTTLPGSSTVISDHDNLLSAKAAMLEPLFTLAVDQGNDPDDPSYVWGWSALLDVDLCPTQYLPFLAQFVGATIPAGASDADARSVIRAESNQHRGTMTAIVSAAQRNMSGTKTVTVLERTGADGSTADPWHFCLIVLTSEVVSVSQLTADVNGVKPGGVLWTLIQTSSWTIAQLEAAEASVTAAEAFASVNNLETDV